MLQEGSVKKRVAGLSLPSPVVMAPLFYSCPLWIGSLFLAYTSISKYFGDGIGEKQEEARIKTAQKLNKQVCPVLNTKITNPSHISRHDNHDFLPFIMAFAFLIWENNEISRMRLKNFFFGTKGW